MTPFRYSLIGFVIFSALIACSTSSTTSIVTQLPQTTPEEEESASLPTITVRPSFAPLPSGTPNLTQTATYRDNVAAQSVELTVVAQYPRICKNTNSYMPPSYSPEKLWMEEFCFSEADDSPILTLSNKKTQILWKMVYRDFVENMDGNGLGVVHWSPDQKYAYFASFPIIDGGECYLGKNSQYFGEGLFRVDLQTGVVTTILPPQDNFRSYDFSFSPTGRRLIYQTYPSGLVILDLKTGESISVKSVEKNRSGGGYLWSSDGLELIYSTVIYNEISEPIAYSLRLVDAQIGSQRILIESPENCFAAKSWSDDNILTIESYDKDYNQTLVEYDLNSNKIISGAIATP
jgi:hypothetical protein